MFDESPSEAWSLRYGSPAPDLPDLQAFLNHRSVRQFADEPVPEPVVQGLVAAAQSAATSSNLQLWTAVSVQDPGRREKITQLCGNQMQVRTAPLFFAFLADVYRLKAAAAKVGESAAGLDYTEFYTMACIDAALAAERMVCAAEYLGYGICYIGGLRNDPEGVKQLLNLPEGVFGVFGLCIGRPSETNSAQIKPRLAQNAVWFQEQYDHEADTEEYDRRMSAFYESQQMKGDVVWSMRSGRRVDGNHMTGRETQLEFVQRQGFLRR